MEWRFVSVDTKARKVVAGTHLVKVGSSNLSGGGFFLFRACFLISNLLSWTNHGQIFQPTIPGDRPDFDTHIQ